MRVCIHRGSDQIGGSCVEVEQNGQRLIVDLGLPLDTETNDPNLLPHISGLSGDSSSLLGILISHPHRDHYGLLVHISDDMPIGAGPAARRILKAAAPFIPNGFHLSDHGWDYESGKEIEIGPFRVTPYLVDHSAYDAYSLRIEAEGKSIYYTGDFRGHGRKSALYDRLIADPPQNIDALLLEGSSLGRIGADVQFATEDDLEREFVQEFQKTKGLALVHTSIQNLDRIVTTFRAAKRSGRKLVIDLYAASVFQATGNGNMPQSSWDEVALFVPEIQRVDIVKNKWFDNLNKHSTNRIFLEAIKNNPAEYVMLFRPVYQPDLENGKCLEGASYIYSMWDGYWERGNYDKVKRWLEGNGIPRTSIHTSGHASPVDLKKFVEALKPKRVVPIHSFAPETYSELFNNVDPHPDGEWWDV